MSAIDPTSTAHPAVQPSLPLASANASPAFDPEKVVVVFFVGGPGAGKGTQSEFLTKDYGFNHYSAGDLLREEQDREGTEYGQLIRDYIKEGQIVPMEVTVKLLENAMRAKLSKTPDGTGRFLIDGFPRKMDQGVFFEESVCPSTATLWLDCPEDIMMKRVLKRGETSGRTDDNVESTKKRFKVFMDQSMPVIDYFEGQGKVMKVSAVGSPEEVYANIKKALEEKGLMAP
ncbi:MAG: hypothetical protein Q9227_006024 [Pyrenula ochraceoflavens]